MSWTAGCIFAIAAIALGRALQINNGFLHPTALVWLLAALALSILGVVLARARGRLDEVARSILPYLLLTGLFTQAAQLLAAPPLMYAPIRRGLDDLWLSSSVVVSALMVTVITFAPTRLRAAAFAVLIVVHSGMGIWVVRTVPEPRIDVVTVHREAVAALTAGRSPYSITFRDIYGGGSGFYAEGMTSQGRVLFGYPYPPLTLLIAAPAEIVFGDFRFAEVAGLSLAALLIASLGWTRHSMLAASLLLTTPRVLFELEQGWTEPIAILVVCATAAAIWRRSSSVSVALGLALAVKQYVAAALVLIPVLPAVGIQSRKLLLVALGAGAAVTVPFLVWDPTGFVNSVVLLQMREPFRRDSLSVLAWLAAQGMSPPAIASTVAAGLLATTLSLWVLPRSTGGFAAGLALITFALFAFGKKAFCNYYFFVLGALAVAIAASGERATGVSGDNGFQKRSNEDNGENG